MKNRYISNALLLALLVSLVTAPLGAYAKDKDDKGDDDKGRTESRMEDKGKGIPPGQAKKFWGWDEFWKAVNSRRGHATTTVTVIPLATTTLTISDMSATSSAPRRANVIWNTNLRSDSTLWYSTSSPVNTSLAISVSHRNDVLKHKIELTKLEPNTRYYVIARSVGRDGKTATSSEISFVTKAAPVPATTTTTTTLVLRNATVIFGSTGLTAAWKTSLDSDSEFYYSTSSPVVIGATSTIGVITPALVKDHSMRVDGLSPGTTYFMLIRSKDASGNTVTTPQFSLTTMSL